MIYGHEPLYWAIVLPLFLIGLGIAAWLFALLAACVAYFLLAYKAEEGI